METIVAPAILSKRRRREKLNEKFVALKSLIPSLSKADKASVLGDAIKYVKDLKRGVADLETCREPMELSARRKHLDAPERTEDSDTDVSDGWRASSGKKRKACIVKEGEEAEGQWVLSSGGGPVNMNITVIGREVAVKMCCPWRDRLFLDVIDATSGLDLDVHSMQSTTECGVLGMELKAKFRGSAGAAPGVIGQALQSIVGEGPRA